MPLASTRMKRGEPQSRRGNRMNKGKKWQISMIKAVGAKPPSTAADQLSSET